MGTRNYGSCHRLLSAGAYRGRTIEPGLEAEEAEEVIPVEAFRYIFKRPLE
jgi:hypothetical protein